MSLHDTQSAFDNRNIAINRVGIKDFKLPIQLASLSGVQATIATVDMFASLEAKYRGTHMSRFISLITANAKPICAESIKELTQQLCKQLETTQAEISLTTSLFVEKKAPITQIRGLMDYQVKYHTCVDANEVKQILEVKTPTTSLCPCSKEISAAGAHNQRSVIVIKAQYRGTLFPEQLIEIAEKSSSCDLYSILKRADEKFVTETAYAQPKFVEDTVREAYQALKNIPEIIKFKVASENFESIHNHSAYAEVTS
ncbi:MAG: GTP cyclohydrolase FolE2 [Neisseriaceae bacterium]